jgi:hypothetical protein
VRIWRWKFVVVDSLRAKRLFKSEILARIKVDAKAVKIFRCPRVPAQDIPAASSIHPSASMRAVISSRPIRLLRRQIISCTSNSSTKKTTGASITSLHRTGHDGVSPPDTTQLRHAYRRHFHSKILHQEDTTIYALSTATGRAAIAVIRISGPACKQVQFYHLKHICNPPCNRSLNLDIPGTMSRQTVPKT